MPERRTPSTRRLGALRIGPRVALCATLSLAALALLTPGALAGAPATVTVRVVGLGDSQVIPLTTVTTNSTPVYPLGGNPADTCPGTSALGALQLASQGNWSGKWFESSHEYLVEGIREPPLSEPNYWSFWLNDQYATTGMCDTELANGDQILLFPECFAAKGCPTPPNVLAIEVPPTVETGEPVQVTVMSYPNPEGPDAGQGPQPVDKALIAGADQSAETDAEGHATLTFSIDDTYTLTAILPETETGVPAIPAEAAVCAHDGNDGTCGTQSTPENNLLQGPASSNVIQGSQQKTPVTTPQNGIFASATGLIDGHHYPRNHAPRVLAGAVFSSTPVSSISISLRRTAGGRCYVYNGRREHFEKVRCSKQASFFKINHNGSAFSYLLPSRLPPGSYVFEVKATDTAGAHTSLVRGSSRVTFYVK